MAFDFETLTDPDRIRVTERGAWVATFTIGYYAVTLAGPSRVQTIWTTKGRKPPSRSCTTTMGSHSIIAREPS